MKSLTAFFKKEFVLVIAGVAAFASCLFVPFTNYARYINVDTIGLLFCLMVAIAGFRESNLLAAASCALLGKGNASARKAGSALVSISFFASMLFTNDVALIAFVPMAAALFKGRPKNMIYVITVQTAAANLGSMLTPFGNPQNLFLYGHYGMTPWEFFSAVLPVSAVNIALIFILCLFIKDEPLDAEEGRARIAGGKGLLAVYSALFFLCQLAVFGVLDVAVLFVVVCACVFVANRKLFAGVDYGLLLTFVFFFVFVGNIQNVPAVRAFITRLLEGREMLASAAVSQVISNVPAAVMLSGFTENARALVLGTNIGGLGTIVASLASLISLRIYMGTDGARPLKYLGVFTLVNVVLLATVYAFAANFVI